ncbi:hypothetical protein [Atlantibacter hermannii]|uniref:hypothetical protein n=1 Tax=Atlantibacter hermannii TaxID=565 RepID=UPI0028A6C132|nr:hypothetical protein [Atlantibacter hermannii]
MPDVINLNSAQQRHKDREMLKTIEAALQFNEDARLRLEEARRELINRLGINKTNGPEDAA